MSEYKFCKLDNENHETYVLFEILGREQKFNHTTVLHHNLIIKVNLRMLKGVVKKIRNARLPQFSSDTKIGTYYDTDSLGELGCLDYEVLFTDNVKVQYKVNSHEDVWHKCEPLTDTKSGIKFYHVNKNVYDELSKIVELNDKTVLNRKSATVDL